MQYKQAGFDIQGARRGHVNRKIKKWKSGKNELPKEAVAVPNETKQASGVSAECSSLVQV